jgi:anti-sigma B factor antagonist
MTQTKLRLNVRPAVSQGASQVSIIDLMGDVTGEADHALTDAYEMARHAKFIILNFSGLEYMNSSGIGLLVTLLIRTQRHGQKLMAFGLSDHYREIFELTRLNEAIEMFISEADALTAAKAV